MPCVPALFGYFHRDAPELLRSPEATVVIDDARRFLERTQDTFDVILIDPPPPIEAAGSSLLYSREFYEAATRRLSAGGILQQWLPATEEPIVVSAVAQALDRSFRYTRVFRSVEGWGYHILASATPIANRTASELAARVPPRAAHDLVEWGPGSTVPAQFEMMLSKEVRLAALIQPDPQAPMLTDDRTVNEYYILRRTLRTASAASGN